MSNEKHTDILLVDFIAALDLLGYRLTIVYKESIDATETECINECCCEVEVPQETQNPFIKAEYEQRQEIARLGLSDLKYWEQCKVKNEAEKLIQEKGITNEEEIRKVYGMIRDFYIEYREYLKNEKAG